MRWLLLLLVFAPASNAIPVIPNFTQGSLTSHTETTSKVSETIVSEDYMTGFQYSASGTNIEPDSSINPATTGTVNGWTTLGERTNWSIVEQGQPFQFVETLNGPGLSNRTTIQRVTEVTSITDSVSVFSQ